MAVFSGLVRRATAEAERRLRGGLGLLGGLGRDLERSARLERLLPAYDARLRRLEEVLAVQDAGLLALRAELDSLVTQLNDRLLPRIDERMDDAERDLVGIATGLIRAGQDAAGGRGRLEALEGRVSDLRGKLSQMEQRAGLWRDLQATMARLGDDIDALRSRVASGAPAPGPDAEPERAAEPAAAPEELSEAMSATGPEPVPERSAERQAGERVGGPEARS